MPAGRPSKPTQIKELQGTLEKYRETPNKMDPKVMDSIPAAPGDLDEVAQRTWYHTATELHAFGILSTLDLVLLKEYCYQVSLMERARLELKDSLTITITNKGGHSYETKSPYIQIYNEALGHANRLAQQFGFTPAARQRIVAPKTEEGEDDPWQKF